MSLLSILGHRVHTDAFLTQLIGLLHDVSYQFERRRWCRWGGSSYPQDCCRSAFDVSRVLWIYIYGILEPLGPGRLFPCQFFESTFGSKEEETADPEMPMEIGNQVFVKGKGRGILALDNEDGTWYLCLQ